MAISVALFAPGVVPNIASVSRTSSTVCEPYRYVIESAAFRPKFSNTTEVQLFEILTRVCNRKSGGPLGTEQIEIIDNNGERHEFVFESFCFPYTLPDGNKGYQVLTLAVHKRRLPRVILVGSAANA